MISFSKAVETGSTIGNVKLGHLWSHDLVRYSDGTIAILGQGRVDGSLPDDPDLRMFYVRYDGTAWKTTYLVRFVMVTRQHEPRHSLRRPLTRDAEGCADARRSRVTINQETVVCGVKRQLVLGLQLRGMFERPVRCEPAACAYAFVEPALVAGGY